jgi:hypothetical protein
MTRNSNHGLYAVAAAVLVVGVVALDVPLGSLATFGLILACPLMMIFMMRSMGGHGMHGHDSRGRDESRDQLSESADDGDRRGTRR